MDQRINAVLEALGITRYGDVAVAEFVFRAEYRDACAMNRCGKYGTNWACPPGAGSPEALEARVRQFARGLVIQTVWPIEDKFDFEGMLKGGERHNALFQNIAARLAPLLPEKRILALGAGVCPVCRTCTCLDGQPCRHPDQAMISLEACCVDVAPLLSRAGLSYTNGPDTVSYVGVILYGPAAAGSVTRRKGLCDGRPSKKGGVTI